MAKQSKSLKSARSRRSQKQSFEEVNQPVQNESSIVINEEEVEKQPSNDDCEKSVYELEDCIIGAILKHRDAFSKIYSILGFDYHFKGFLQSLVWIASSELRRMNINIEPSTVASQLKHEHKTDVDISQLEMWKNNAPSVDTAIQYAQSLKSA